MRTYTFSVPDRLPGLNEYTKACNSNTFNGAKMKKECQELIQWYIKAQLGDAIKAKQLPPKVPVKVYFKWTEAGRQPRDKDNIAVAKKFLLDAMVAEGVLLDDAWDYVDGFEDAFERGKHYGVTVDILILDK